MASKSGNKVIFGDGVEGYGASGRTQVVGKPEDLRWNEAKRR